MAWRAFSSGDQEWDSLINGLKWLRRRELGGYKYLYLIDNFDAVPEPLMQAAEKMEWGGDIDHVDNIKTAGEWAAWEHASVFWSADLAQAEEEEARRARPRVQPAGHRRH